MCSSDAPTSAMAPYLCKHCDGDETTHDVAVDCLLCKHCDGDETTHDVAVDVAVDCLHSFTLILCSGTLFLFFSVLPDFTSLLLLQLLLYLLSNVRCEELHISGLSARSH
eukprot:scpid53829/ scgid3356/ 